MAKITFQLTHPQAAKVLKIGVGTLTQLADSGQIPYNCSGKGTRKYRLYNHADLEAYQKQLAVLNANLLTLKQAAAEVGVSPSAIFKQVARGGISGAQKINRILYVPKTEVERLKAEHQQQKDRANAKAEVEKTAATDALDFATGNAPKVDINTLLLDKIEQLKQIMVRQASMTTNVLLQQSTTNDLLRRLVEKWS